MSESTEEEIRSIIADLQNEKSSDIPIGVIKKSSKSISSILFYHFNFWESYIYSRLYNFFTAQGILHDGQFGSRKFHSTSHALNYSTDLKKKY